MRFLSVFTLTCAVLQATSALPVFNLANDPIPHDELYPFASRNAELLEARGKVFQHKGSKKHVPPPVSPVTFAKGVEKYNPDNHLDRLGLYSDKRKEVEKWHKKVVGERMKTVQNAKTAKIVNLAHSIGSQDPNIHISAIFYDKSGRVVLTPQRGNGELRGTAHVYTNKERPEDGYHPLPIEYKKAMDKNAIREGRHEHVGRA